MFIAAVGMGGSLQRDVHSIPDIRVVFFVEGGTYGFEPKEVGLVSAPEHDRCLKMPSMMPHCAIGVLDAFCRNWQS